ncbi:MAG: D-glycero-beta-D-manno-heptose 1,7-bisphosphate 7-phosphatase [Neisseriaceae bacterium]|nr:D-glycero-beta-D-manno-heptose 1,7-bisphosphate 7-phosphatase [Neisseriaceae bacterium]
MKLIILDRDGVINKDRNDYVKSAEEWVLIPQSADAIAFLNQSGYTVAVATNQSGIGRGLFTMHDLNQIHAKMYRTVQQAGGNITGVWFCPHTPEDECECRKPKTGMIRDIITRFGALPEETYLVGDSLRDLQAIEEVGGMPVLVLTGKGQKTLEQHEEQLPLHTQVFEDLWSFSQAIYTLSA